MEPKIVDAFSTFWCIDLKISDFWKTLLDARDFKVVDAIRIAIIKIISLLGSCEESRYHT